MQFFVYLLIDEIWAFLKTKSESGVLTLDGKEYLTVNGSPIADLITELDEEAKIVLQNYFDLVLKDDLTYMNVIKSLNLPEDELRQKLANFLVRDTTSNKICKFSESTNQKEFLAKQSKDASSKNASSLRSHSIYETSKVISKSSDDDKILLTNNKEHNPKS